MTNAYAQALATLQQQPDHELKQIGDQWQTPPEIAWGLFYTFAPKIGPIVLDIFADDCNALVANYYTASDNALLQDLAGDLRQLGGAAFGNPPYSIPKVDSENNPITGMENILDWCRVQRDQGAKIMLLIKAATSEGWWPDDADFIQFVAGRIGFKAPNWYKPRDPKKDKPSASGFASAVMIWDKEWKWDSRPVERLSRDQLFTTGRMLLDMINVRAEQIADSRLPAAAPVEASIPSSLLLPLIEKVRQQVRRWPHNPDFWNNEFYQDGITYFHKYLEWAIKAPESILGNIECPLPPTPLWTKKLLEAAQKTWDTEDAEPLSQLISRCASESEQLPQAPTISASEKTGEQAA